MIRNLPMARTDPTEPTAQRVQLAAALRALRRSADLSGEELAARTGLSQPMISRIETARRVPSREMLTAWATATGATDQQLAELQDLAEVALTELTTRQLNVRAGHVENQRRVRDREAVTGVQRNFQPLLIPGLLQTADYARLVFASASFPTRPGPSDPAAAAAARIDRQTILYDTNHRFEFVLGEPALRWWFGSVTAQLAQLDRIGTVATLPNVTIGVLPLNASVPTWHSHGFVLYDEPSGDEDPLVKVTTLSGTIDVQDSKYVAAYREAFTRLQALAVTGNDLSGLLNRIMKELPR